MPKVKIYIVTHHRDEAMYKLDDPMYVPILAGKALYDPIFDNFKGNVPELGDNTGDNISKLNPYYCELSVFYWIWKNDDSDPDDIIGVEHYRRHFRDPFSESESPIKRETILEWLDKCEFIVNGTTTYETDQTRPVLEGEETVYDNYKSTHNQKEMDLALECISKEFPELYDKVFAMVMRTGAFCWNNVMIARKKHLDEYCNFIFTVSNYIQDSIQNDPQDNLIEHSRCFGFLSERLFRPWLVATGYRGMSPGMLNWEEYSGYEWK